MHGARQSLYDAVVVGSGPNGLAAAITLARAGRSVIVLERNAGIGGGVRSAALTNPGFIHDTCSAVYPMALASPFFRGLPLSQFGLEWIDPPAALAHPLDDGTAAILYRSVDATAETLGEDDKAYSRWMKSWLPHWDLLIEEILAPLHLPRKPLTLLRFGLQAVRSAAATSRSHFRQPRARALFGGLAAHSFLPLTQPPSSAIGIVLGLAGHAVGWPIPRGGAARLSEALAAYFKSLGGEIVTETPVLTPSDLPASRQVFFDVTPPQFIRIAGDKLPERYRRQLEKFRYGPGVFKVDWALSSPIPWRSAGCAKAATVHVGGTLDEMIASEKAPWVGECAERPFVLLVQPSLLNPSRAPQGRHTAWGYCHVPRGSTADMTGRIEAQVERFAPGFRDCILARHVFFPADIERANPNFVGGDISGGIADLRQAFFRPVVRWNPYETPVPNWFVCSASTPPGTGVHGMCGYNAARAALEKQS